MRSRILDSSVSILDSPASIVDLSAAMANTLHAATTRNIAIIGYGRKHPMAWHVQEMLSRVGNDSNMLKLDLTQLMPNPADYRREPCRRGCDSTNSFTVIAVTSQPRFPEVIESIVESVENNTDIKFVVVNCTTGFHRADTTGTAMQWVLNNLKDDEGKHRYNAQYFGTCNYNDQEGITRQLAAAWTWSTRPWCSVKASDCCEQWAAWVRQRSASYENWKRIRAIAGVHSGRDRQQGGQTHRGFDRSEGQAPEAPNRKLATPPKSSAQKPPTPLVSTAPQSAARREEKIEQAAKKARTEPVAIGAPSGPAPWIKHRVSGGEASEEQSSPASSWQQVGTFAVSQWVDLLKEMQVDKTAQQALFLLSQFKGKSGIDEANLIISQLLKKKRQGEYMPNPSGFVHKAVTTARRRLLDEA